MQIKLLLLLVLPATLMGCGQALTDIINGNQQNAPQQRYTMKGDGIEECLSADRAVYSVALSGTGTKWDFFYQGEIFSLQAAQLAQAQSNLPADIIQDQVTLKKCDGKQLVVRQSIRRVILRNKQGQVMFDGQLNCVGYPPNGLALLPDEMNLCNK